MNTLATKTILIFALISYCASAKTYNVAFDDYYKNARKFYRRGTLSNCWQEIPRGFVEVDPRPIGGFDDSYEEIEFGKVIKKETISMNEKNDKTLGYAWSYSTREIYCYGREREKFINIRTEIRYDKKYASKSLSTEETQINIGKKYVYSNTNWFENEKLVRIRQSGLLIEVAQGETPCEIIVAKPRYLHESEYGLYINAPYIIKIFIPNANSAVFLLHPERPVVLEQQLLIDPYDAIKYYWYPYCKIYGEQFIEKDSEGLFWRKHSRLFSPYWNKTDNQNPKEHL